MCQEFKNAKKVVDEFIEGNEDFTYNELKKNIIDRDGVLCISASKTVSDYLHEFEVQHKIIYDSWENVYRVTAEAH